MFNSDTDGKIGSRWIGPITALGVTAFAVLGAVLLVLFPLRIEPHFEPYPLVAALQKPSSIHQLKLSLAEANRKLQSAQTPEVDKQYLLLAIVDVLRKYPEASEAWQIASSMITSRAPLVGPAPSETCGEDLRRWPDRNEQQIGENGVLPKFTNCTIVLDDAAQIFNGSPIFNKEHLARYARGERRPLLPLKSVQVINRGGEILPINAIAFERCTFDFDVRSAPPGRGKALIRTMLGDSDLSNVGVELSGSEGQVANRANGTRLK